jgi:hypothetical protein
MWLDAFRFGGDTPSNKWCDAMRLRALTRAHADRVNHRVLDAIWPGDAWLLRLSRSVIDHDLA